MKTYKVTVYRMIDFDILGDRSHVSISGGVATHSFHQIDEFECHSVDDVLERIKMRYGPSIKPYIFDDRLEYSVSESETLSFYIEETRKIDDCHKLKKLFPMLEDIS